MSQLLSQGHPSPGPGMSTGGRAQLMQVSHGEEHHVVNKVAFERIRYGLETVLNVLIWSAHFRPLCRVPQACLWKHWLSAGVSAVVCSLHL